jgi:hypothetical protein
MYHLPVTINKAYLLQEQEHEYITTYTFNTTETDVPIERKALPQAYDNMVLLDGNINWIPLDYDSMLAIDRNIYQSFQFRVNIPYSAVTQKHGYADVVMSAMYNMSDNREYVLLQKTFSDGRTDTETHYWNIDSQYGTEVGFVLSAKRVVWDYPNRLSNENNYTLPYPANYIVFDVRGVNGNQNADGDWVQAVYNGGHFETAMLLDRDTLFSTKKEITVTKTEQRSVII